MQAGVQARHGDWIMQIVGHGDNKCIQVGLLDHGAIVVSFVGMSKALGHEDEVLYMQGAERILEALGSCVTLVAALLHPGFHTENAC